MIPGTPITLGEKKYLLPPLNFRALILHKDFMRAAAAGTIDAENAFENLEKIAEILLAALKRNYPQITMDEVGEGLDMGNMTELLQHCFKTSGFQQSIDTPSGERAPEAGPTGTR